MSLHRGIALLEALVDAAARQKHGNGPGCGEAADMLSLCASPQHMTTLASLVDEAREVEARGQCLPIKVALRLQDVAQRAWNASTEGTWTGPSASPCDASTASGAKLLYRQLITHYFLLATNYFAPVKTRDEYFANHSYDAEKAVLMCLKTAKGLASYRRDAHGAAELIEHALAIVTLPVTAAAAGSIGRADIHLEVLFTGLSVHWDLGQWEEALELATTLQKETVAKEPYRESLLQFIFSVAAGEDRNVVHSGLDRNCATLEPSPPGKEASLQALLTLSLQVQQEGGQRGQKHRTLFGVTLLQLASSQFRAGSLCDAAANAKRAYEEMQSLEPLVLLVQVYAKERERLGAAFDVLRDITQLSMTHSGARAARAVASDVFSPSELISLATILVDAARASAADGHDGPVDGEEAFINSIVTHVTDAVFSGCTSQKGSAAAADVISFLLHVRTDLSLCKMCEWIDNTVTTDGETEPRPSADHRRDGCPPYQGRSERFYFCAAWGAGAEEPNGSSGNNVISADTRFKCLETALRCSRVGAAEEETESVLVAMSELALTQFCEGGGDDSRMLTTCFVALQQLSRPSLPAALALCQVAFSVDHGREKGQRAVRELLLSCDGASAGGTFRWPVAAVVAACGTLVNYLLSVHLIEDAGFVAALVAGVGHEKLGATCPMGVEERLAFIQVCTDAVLVQLRDHKSCGPALSDSLADFVAELCQVILELVEQQPDREARCVLSVEGESAHDNSQAGDGGSTREALAPSFGSSQCHGSDSDAQRSVEPALSRWCRILWYFGSEVVVHKDARRALLAYGGATDVFLKHCYDGADAKSKELLAAAALYALSLEFDLFVSGMPVLSIDALDSYVTVARGCHESALGVRVDATVACDAALSPTVVIALAEVETWLRRRLGCQIDNNHSEEEERGDCVSKEVVVAVTDESVEEVVQPPSARRTHTEAPVPWSAEALAAIGVPREELQALAAAVGSTAALLRQDITLTRFSVELQLTAVSSLLLPGVAKSDAKVVAANPASSSPSTTDEETTVAVLQLAASAIFQAYQLAGDDDALQLRVTESAADLLSKWVSSASPERNGGSPERWPREVTAEAFFDDDMEAVVEFLAVQAWNKAVALNAIRARQQVSTWRALALSLCALLPSANRSTVAIPAFSEKMPLL